MSKIAFIDEVAIINKRVIMRADFDVTLDPSDSIADDFRIKQNLPTLKHLLKNQNRVICIAKLGRPQKRDPKLSLRVVVERLRNYLPGVKIRLIDDFLTEPPQTFANQKPDELFVLENIRFYPEEKQNDKKFAQKLAHLADIYVNDAFAVSHRVEASVVSIADFIPGFGGILLKREIEMITKATAKPKKPLVAIIGGAKISTKMSLINHLIELADFVLLAGGLANPFFKAQRFGIGKSVCEYEMVQKAQQLLFLAAQKHTAMILPTDVLVGDPMETEKKGKVLRVKDNLVPKDQSILDIGPETQALYGSLIAKAKTIIWNGPVGLFENPAYRHGTDFIYYSIAHNPDAVSIVGGGDTLCAISNQEYLDKITHVSTGGGSMLEFIEKATLPGIEALKQQPPSQYSQKPASDV